MYSFGPLFPLEKGTVEIELHLGLVGCVMSNRSDTNSQIHKVPRFCSNETSMFGNHFHEKISFKIQFAQIFSYVSEIPRPQQSEIEYYNYNHT